MLNGFAYLATYLGRQNYIYALVTGTAHVYRPLLTSVENISVVVQRCDMFDIQRQHVNVALAGIYHPIYRYPLHQVNSAGFNLTNIQVSLSPNPAAFFFDYPNCGFRRKFWELLLSYLPDMQCSDLLAEKQNIRKCVWIHNSWANYTRTRQGFMKWF
jgi:hypothetical protein